MSDFDDANSLEAPIATAVLAHIVRSIVDDADAVNVTSGPAGRQDPPRGCVGPGDLGRVIGRRGRTAQSIRTVVRAAATTTMLMSTSTLSTPEQFAPQFCA